MTITSHPATDDYRAGWERVFGNKPIGSRSFLVWEEESEDKYRCGIGSYVLYEIPRSHISDGKYYRDDLISLCQQRANMICDAADLGLSFCLNGNEFTAAVARDDLMKHEMPA